MFDADKEGHRSMSAETREYDGCDELKMNDFPQDLSSSRLVPRDGRMHVCKRVTLRASHSARPVLSVRMAWTLAPARLTRSQFHFQSIE